MMSIVYPIFTLVIFTFVVSAAVGGSRLLSVRRREINPKYYALMSGDTPPDYVQKLGRNYANLLEMPVLFYLLGALVVALEINHPMLTNGAWLYVALRFVHSGIHITYNNSIHRLVVFVLSVFCLLAMWIQFFLLLG
ncbi:MAG: MAPEG family protein [Porticoccaceae bacterium]